MLVSSQPPTHYCMELYLYKILIPHLTWCQTSKLKDGRWGSEGPEVEKKRVEFLIGMKEDQPLNRTQKILTPQQYLGISFESKQPAYLQKKNQCIKAAMYK